MTNIQEVLNRLEALDGKDGIKDLWFLELFTDWSGNINNRHRDLEFPFIGKQELFDALTNVERLYGNRGQ